MKPIYTKILFVASGFIFGTILTGLFLYQFIAVLVDHERESRHIELNLLVRKFNEVYGSMFHSLCLFMK
jgi:hypothetical protein